MAKIYITEYARAENGIPQEPEITTQVVTFTTHTESSAFNPSTSYVRIQPDAICSVAFGTAAVATTSSRRMIAGQTETVKVPTNKLYLISAVTNT